MAVTPAPAPTTTSLLSSSARPTCRGRIMWLTVPDRDVRECVLLGGHRGDHRDAAGYSWNEGRWLD